jgi:hypothetical protein
VVGLLVSTHEVGLGQTLLPSRADRSRRPPPDAAVGYLAQPDEMGELIQAALELGWTLWRYEADFDHAPVALVEQGLMSRAFTNWREAEQARNLAAVLAGLAAGDRLLVWCGNGHASRVAGDAGFRWATTSRPWQGRGLCHRPDGDGGLCGP